MARPTYEILISLYRIGLLPRLVAERELLALINPETVEWIMPLIPGDFIEDIRMLASNFDPAVEMTTLAGVRFMTRESSLAINAWFARNAVLTTLQRNHRPD